MSAPRDGRTTQQGRDGRSPEAPGSTDPYLEDTYRQDPYAQDPYAQERYAEDPYGQDPYAQHPYGGSPYPQSPLGPTAPPQNLSPQDVQGSSYPAPSQATEPYAHDPYAHGSYGQGAQPDNPYAQQGDPRAAQPGYPQQPTAYTDPYAQAQPGYPQQGGGAQQPGYAYPQPGGAPQWSQEQQNQPSQQPQPPAVAPGTGFGAPQPYHGAAAPGVEETAQQPSAPQPERPPGGDPYGFLFRDGEAGDAARPVPDTDTGWTGRSTPAAPGAEYLDPRGQDHARAYEETYRQNYGPNYYGEAAGDLTAETTGSIPVIDREAPEFPGPAESGADARKGKVGSILSSSALMAAGTLVSRGTGFLRTMVIAQAIGIATMGSLYSIANTLPTMIYILVGGGAINAVFVPQLVRSMKNDEDGGEAYANRLLTLVICGLGAVVLVMVVAAPLLIRMVSASTMNDPQSAAVTVALARYCLPTIFFMGVHVVMGQILNARGKFGAMMWTPVLNNVVVIFTFGMYIWVFGSYHHTQVQASTISPAGVRLLGVGTLLGLAVQALAMVPYLRNAGLRFRPRFDWRGHGLGHAAKLARWTFLFVLANQFGLVVVTQLSTAAGKIADNQGFQGFGYAAYTNAQLIWQLPQAVITVSVMSAVLPRISRAASDGDAAAVRDDLSYGLRTSAVAIVPFAFLFLSMGPWIGILLYGLGSSSGAPVGYMLSAFALGLVPYSAQYVMLRGFYAYEDTRTPFYNTVWVAATNAVVAVICYAVLPAKWAVTGMAFGYGIAYVVGVIVAVPRLRRRIGDLDGRRVRRTYTRLIGASIIPAALGYGAAHVVSGALHGGLIGTLAALVVGAVIQMLLFLVIAKRMRIEELTPLLSMVRAKIGR